jgi:hypothetical protein
LILKQLPVVTLVLSLPAIGQEPCTRTETAQAFHPESHTYTSRVPAPKDVDRAFVTAFATVDAE